MKKIYTAIITSILSLQTLAISAGNVADYAQCEEMVKAVKKQFGSIDALINNAGITA